MSKKLIVANWKENPNSFEKAKTLFSAFKSTVGKIKGVTLVVCPPFIHLQNLSKLSKSSSKIWTGAQNIFIENSGSFTGEVGAKMVKDSGAKFVIVGHSERRAMGENNEEVSRKIRLSQDEGLHTILCVGEKERDNHGNYFAFIQEEIISAFKVLKKGEYKKIIVAYEPIWAVGEKSTGAASAQIIHEMSIFVKKVLNDHFGKAVSDSVSILYGGSTDSKNIKEILEQGNIEGLLVGRSSLDKDEFVSMLKIASQIK